MKIFEIKAFPDVLSKLNIKKQDTLFIHSSLFRFGIPNDLEINKLPHAIFDQLCHRVGNEGTVVVPTFNFDFCRGIPFDRQRTPADTNFVGIFSEFVRKKRQAKRSFHPMQSVAAVGYHADYLTEKDTETAFSPESPFDRFRKLDGKILLLGASVSNVSFIHYVEEMNLVPYRYWKEFKGSYTDNKQTSEKTYQMYVRDLSINPELSMEAIEKELIKQDKLKEAQWGSGVLQSFRIKDFLDIADYCIKQDPYYFIRNHP